MKRGIQTFTLSILLISLSGCFGSFNLTKNVYHANEDVSDNGFVQSAVMVGMFIIPVYEIAGIADLLVFNVIEFWSGDNPISMEEGENRRQMIHANGSTYQMDATKDHITIMDINDADQEMLSLHYDQAIGSWSVSD